ncbi:hypothetical protein BDF19DRAFT_411427 [Syncephalis fuscata]|nr:hypothetical protein BDF19DRAFT_411427 [Syncephalis fuscata]
MPEATTNGLNVEALAAIAVLEPRDYQIEMFEHAKKSNIIAVLETGAGKTLISAMLIKYVLSKEYSNIAPSNEQEVVEATVKTAEVPISVSVTDNGDEQNQLQTTLRRVIMFIVNHVSLVHQQALFMQQNTPYSVGEYHGGMGTDLWDADVWQGELAKNDVMVMTAQILRNALLHGFLQIDQIAMIVIDECHHNKERHPYNEIMKEFYMTAPIHKRPKIFAMTASPLDSKEHVGASAEALEASLDARIVTINKNLLRKYLKRPRECIIRYEPADDFDTTPLLKRLKRFCDDDYFHSYFLDAEVALKELGPWCSDYIWHSFLKAIDRRFPHKDALAKYINQLPEDKTRRCVTNAINIIRKHEFDSPLFNMAHLSPKVLKLLNILSKFATQLPGNTFRGIVFVDRRKHAFIIVALLDKLESMRNIIQCRPMIGSGSSMPGDYQMSYKERNQAVGDFRNGNANLLVTTSVGEEGLDIPACNVVIRFSYFDTLRAYIQSRGRARHPQSAYIIMQERGNAGEMKLLEQIRRHECELELWCKQRPPISPTSADNNVTDEDDQPISAEELEQGQYIEPSTGARITLSSAIPTIYRYCGQLPQDAYCKLAPVWEMQNVDQTNFICNIIFPINAHIRCVNGEVARSKSLAKRLVALRAAIQLREAGALDDRLLPYAPQQPENDLKEFEANVINEGDGLSGTTQEFPRKVPELWLAQPLNESSQWYIYTLTLEPSQLSNSYRPMGIATRQPFPNGLEGIKLYLEDGPTLMRLIPWPRPYYIEVNYRRQVLRKKYKYESIGYLIFPLIESINNSTTELDLESSIDWNQVKECGPLASQQNQPVPLISRLDTIKTGMTIIDATKYSQYYEIAEIRQDLSPVTPLPTNNQSTLLTMKEHLLNTREYSVKRENQPLLHGKLINYKKFNYIEPTPAKQQEMDEQTTTLLLDDYLLPETCQLIPFKASVLRMGLLLPSFLYQMEKALLAVEYGARFNLSTTLENLVHAISTPAIDTKDNYERLEMLGDSILKIMTSTSLYIKHPENHEGLLHKRRQYLIANESLCRLAVERNMFSYIITQKFSRKSWLPAGFVFAPPENTNVVNVNVAPDEEMADQSNEEMADQFNEEMTDQSNETVYTIQQTNSDNDDVVLELTGHRVAHMHRLSQKMLADVIEASLGSCLESYGADAALQCAVKMGIPLVSPLEKWSDFIRLFPPPPPFTPPTDTSMSVNIGAIQRILGYTFSHPPYLVEAFTHASAQAPTTPCYQRLEFLGDAVLDYLVVDLYYHRYPELKPGGISEIKDATVSNEFLSTICQLLGLQQYLDHFSDPLAKEIGEFGKALDARRAELNGVGEYWRGLSPPKVMGDIVESSIGAVYLDSGFDLNVARDLFNRLLVPLIDDRIEPNKVHISPTCRFTKTVQAYGCSLFKFEGALNSDGLYSMGIHIHGELVIESQDGKEKTAKQKVAGLFLDQWDAGEQDVLMHRCNCKAERERQKQAARAAVESS